MSAIEDALSALGFTPDIAMTVATAYSDPSKENIDAVVSAYAENGQVVPAKLLAYLIQLNKERYPDNPYIAGYVKASAPWVFLGASALAYFIFGRKKR